MILTWLAAILAGCAPLPAVDRGADETAIRTVVARLADSWNVRDSAGFASAFAARHDYVALDGQLRLDTTPAGNAAGHREVWQRRYPEGSIVSMEVRAIRFPAPGVAVVQVASRNDFSSGGQRRTLTSTITGILVREEGAWKFAAFNNNAGQGGSGGRPGDQPPAGQGD